MHEEQQQVQRDVVEHDAGKDFVGVELRAQPGGEPGPGRTRAGACQHYPGQRPAAVPVDQLQGHGAAGQGADQQLAFGADVPDARLVGHCQAEGAKQDRQRLDQQFGHAVPIADRGDQQGVQGFQRGMAEQGEQQHAAEQGQHGGQQRRQPEHGARLLAAWFQG